MPIMLAFRWSEYFQLCYSYKYVNILSKARFYINPGLVCIVNLKKYKFLKNPNMQSLMVWNFLVLT